MKFGSIVIVLAATGFAPASAQTAPAPVIRVIGHGSVKTTPNVATISYSLRGEGSTSDQALAALVARRSATDQVVADVADVRTGRLAINEARDTSCDGGEDDDFDAKVRLSKGACAVTGYVATLQVTARVGTVKDAGTIAGLVGRAGAIDPRVSDFDLRDAEEALTAATAAAMADARRQANAIAKASGATLGRLRRVEDQRAATSTGEDIVVTAMHALPAVAAPPIVVSLSPEPVETTATLVVEFEIGSKP
jgi:uncharacterized protein